jgi:hypothetical protein
MIFYSIVIPILLLLPLVCMIPLEHFRTIAYASEAGLVEAGSNPSLESL